MAARRGLHGGPGPWAPQMSASQPSFGSNMPSGRGGRFVPAGPSLLDNECKAALEQILKPSCLPVLVPWMARASATDKRDAILLGRFATVGCTESQNSRTAHRAATEPVVVSQSGRARLAKTVPVSADRSQQDLLSNRSKEHQHDRGRHERRRFANGFAEVPSCSTVDDFHRLNSMNLATDPSAKVLTERARRKLQEWQVRGPEQDPQGAAQAMRALRSLNAAIVALPSYGEHRVNQGGAGEEYNASLFGYSKVVPKGHRNFKAGSLQLSRSAPMFPSPPYLDPEECEAVTRGGPIFMGLFDHPQLQKMKNQERACRSKLSMSGGKQDYRTTSMAMSPL